MFVFKKGVDIARLEEGKIVTDFSLKINKLEDAYLVHIPAYNIHFYTKNEDEIEQSAHESLVSFFKYWIKEQGVDKLLKHMLNLGFTIKSSTDKQIPRAAGGKRRVVQDDELVIS